MAAGVAGPPVGSVGFGSDAGSLATGVRKSGVSDSCVLIEFRVGYGHGKPSGRPFAAMLVLP